MRVQGNPLFVGDGLEGRGATSTQCQAQSGIDDANVVRDVSATKMVRLRDIILRKLAHRRKARRTPAFCAHER